jgi:cobalt-zinc-cadmium efflux system protein
LKDIQAVEGVLGVHDLHVWSINKSLKTLSAHILTNDISISRGARIQTVLNEMLTHKYGIIHATLQLECRDCDSGELYCDITANHHEHAR